MVNQAVAAADIENSGIFRKQGSQPLILHPGATVEDQGALMFGKQSHGPAGRRRAGRVGGLQKPREHLVPPSFAMRPMTFQNIQGMKGASLGHAASIIQAR